MARLWRRNPACEQEGNHGPQPQHALVGRDRRGCGRTHTFGQRGAAVTSESARAWEHRLTAGAALGSREAAAAEVGGGGGGGVAVSEEACEGGRGRGRERGWP